MVKLHSILSIYLTFIMFDFYKGRFVILVKDDETFFMLIAFQAIKEITDKLNYLKLIDTEQSNS